MRGVETRIQEIRHRVFREVARMAYHTEWPVDKRIESLPYKIIPGEVGNFRNDVFLERAIVGERLRLAMGLPCRSAAEHAPLSENIEAADRPETYYTPPLINVIKFACNGCAEKRVLVTEGCQGCLAHPCEEVCPKDAIKLDRYNGRSHIDPGQCINCGRCADVCSYKAIIIQERPCAVACGMDAIGTDANGKAEIDPDKCVSCGMCLVNCPFGAIADKSQIFQVIRAIQSGERVYAAVAPAFVGQFGPKVTPGKLRAAVKQLGFADVFEVAIGADLCATQEAEDFVREVPEELPFMGTSCCPAWSVMAKKLHPDHAHCISMALTPMTLTARLIKHEHPNAKVVFIGPCAAKKLVYDYIFGNEEISNMLFYGLEGQDYELVNGRVKKLENCWNAPAWQLGNQFNAYLTETDEEGVWEATMQGNEEAALDPLFGFVPDRTPIETELATCEAVWQEYKDILYYGLKDYTEVIPEMMSKLEDAGLEKVTTELQNQIDAFLAAKA